MSDLDDKLELIALQVVASKLASRRELLGCSEAEIMRLEEFFSLRLPESYKTFLTIMGHGAGFFMRGTDAFYPSLLKNREALSEVLTLDKDPFVLSTTTFVFSSHQGYIFHFFETSHEDQDPSVWGYREGELTRKKIDDTFTSFLLTAIEEEAEAWSQLQ